MEKATAFTGESVFIQTEKRAVFPKDMIIPQIKKIIPVLSIILTILIQVIMPNSEKHPVIKIHYFTYFLYIGLGVYTILYITSFFVKKLDNKLIFKGAFIGGAVLFFNILNIVTLKLGLLPPVHFPALDRVVGILIEEREILNKCLLYSAKLLGTGYFLGALIGFTTGVLLGFSKIFEYWVDPLIKILGPIPTTAWIPIVLVTFSTPYDSSVFLVALSVWFPTAVMTSSGINNVQKAYFEVAETLGAGFLYKVFKVGIPAAMPQVFLGLFYGTCSSFVTLVVAEMLGAKYGLGWYINWQKDMLAYSNVYAGLIIIAVVFSLILTVIVRVREKVLAWQKGVIKW